MAFYHMKTTRLLGLLLSCLFQASTLQAAEPSRPVPKGYKLQYEQRFQNEASLKDFNFSDAKAWRYAQDKEGGSLELHGKSQYTPKHRSPFNIALLADRSFEDFVLEVEIQSTVKPYAHQDLCLFFGYQTPEHFYYVHLAAKPDPIKAESHAHDIFLVKDAPRLAVAKEVSTGIAWGEKLWHSVRIERNASMGTIRVFFNGSKEPIMHGADTTFRSGHLGLGSFDDKGKFRNLRVWAPSAKHKKAEFFKPKSGSRILGASRPTSKLLQDQRIALVGTPWNDVQR